MKTNSPTAPNETASKNASHSTWLAWVWLAAGYLTNLFFLLNQGTSLTDSDMSAEMILADLLNQEHSILSQNWYYSTELRVFNTQWFYRLGLWLFPDSWHLARVTAAGLLIAVFLVSWLLFSKAAGFQHGGLWTGAALMWPFGRQFWYLALFGSYYLTYMIFSLLSLALMLWLMKTKKHRQTLLAGFLLALLGLMSGLNGIRQLMMLYVPAAAAALILFLGELGRNQVQTWQLAKQRCGDSLRLLSASLIGFLGSVAGYGINSQILAQHYHFYAYDAVTWNSTLHLADLISVWDDFLGLFGFQSNVKVFSLAGFASLCGVVLAAAFLISLIRLCQRFVRLTLTGQFLLTYTLSALLIMGVSFSFLSVVYNSGFWVPLLPFAFAIFQMEAETEPAIFLTGHRLTIGLFTLAITVCSCSTLHQAVVQPYRGNADLPAAVQWLSDNGYANGFATFWNSDAVTELSNGRIEMWTLNDASSINTYNWLQKVSHAHSLPAGEVFLLLNKTDGTPADNLFVKKASGTLVYENDSYAVYSFASASEMAKAAAGS